MMVASEADDAWCPPTLSPSVLSRTWLAWWMVQAASQRTFFSSSPRMVRRVSSGIGSAGVTERILEREGRIANSEWKFEPCGAMLHYSLFATHHSLASH